MFANPPDTSKAGFLTIIEQVLGRLSDEPPRLCGSIPCDTFPNDPPEYVYGPPRLVVVLEGRDTYATSVRGNRVDVELLPGQAIYWGANSWSIPFFNTVNQSFGVVFKPQHVRLIQLVMPGKYITAYCPWWYHTAVPLAGAGLHVLEALTAMAEAGSSTRATHALFVALLEVVRQHLEQDAPDTPTHQRSIAKWETVQAYLEEHFGRTVTRESVAEALNLHPNYLSALARQVAGRSFHSVLENIRIHHGRRLLKATDLKTSRIAQLCGYRDAARFATVFRRVAGMTPTQFRCADPAPK